MKKVLIVFTDIHLAYSPTTLNIFRVLKERGFDVTLLAAEPEAWFSNNRFEEKGIEYIKYNNTHNKNIILRTTNRAFHKAQARIGKQNDSWNIFAVRKAKAFAKRIKADHYDEIIAVDFLALWCIEKLGLQAHFLSLEIVEKEVYKPTATIKCIKSVLIQSSERFDYLFRNCPYPYHIIPNSPFYKDFDIHLDKRNQYDLVYCGSATVDFGFISCLDFLCDYPEYNLTVIGAVPQNVAEIIELFYKHLLIDNRLILDKKYYEASELPEVVAKKRIGLVFYDFYRSSNMRAVNYYTVPSGKLFQYFNSGIPVIGNELSGFSVVKEYKSGQLIPHISSFQIKKAIDIIESDYESYAINAKRVSKDYDARNAINAFIDKELLTKRIG